MSDYCWRQKLYQDAWEEVVPKSLKVLAKWPQTGLTCLKGTPISWKWNLLHAYWHLSQICH